MDHNHEITFYFVRHGETQYNIEKRVQGHCDSPLTEKGIQQAVCLGKGLAAVPFMAAYSSDSKRALDTAKTVIGKREIPIIQDARFREMNFGDFEALEEAKLPHPHEHFFADLYSMKDLDFAPPGGESLSQVFRRTDAAVKDIIDTYQNKSGNILVFTHGVTLGNYMMHLKGDHEYPVHRNCAVSVVKFCGDDYHIEKIADRSLVENC